MVLDTQEAVQKIPVDRDISPVETNRRAAPRGFCVLLPVWGESYIRQFLECSLLTLLADGNLPALARALPTRFVFLTRKEDEKTIRAHRAYLRLRQVCAVEFLPIDDLIISGNHSTTTTLAWERAVRREGEVMLDTCFVFLVSDYVMADGSLATIAARMLDGADAIQAGNFQLNEDAADPWLQARLAAAGEALSLGAREMVRWGLGCLHPATLANTVNYPLYHNAHTNRLFWRVDRNTLIGRFYLLHQICIRPQTTDFVIGSASDYSFVAEMCPAGNVVILTDSDDYFVAEVQPLHHESHFIRLGPHSIDELAACLSEWTNPRHRLNAKHTIVFHAEDLPASLPVLAEADKFIRDVTPRLGKEQPLRNHPYWIGAIAALHAATGQRHPVAAGPVTRLLRWLRTTFVGRVPYVSRLHPRRRDYRVLMAACEGLTDLSSSLLIETGDATGIGEALRRRVPDAMPFSLRASSPNQAILGIGDKKYDAAFIGLVNEDFGQIEPRLRRLAAVLRPGGQIVLAMLNTDGAIDLNHAGRAYATRFAALASTGLAVADCRIVSVGWWRRWMNIGCARAAEDLFSRGRKFAPLTWLRAALWGVPALTANVVSSLRAEDPSNARRVISSILVRLTVEPEAHETAGAIVRRQRKSHGYRLSRINDMGRYAELFDGVIPWSGHVPGGYLVDFSGAMTAAEFTNEIDDPRFRLMVASDVGRLVYTSLPVIADGEVWFEAANWVMAAREARGRFVMMTLGANYGAQAVCSYRVLQQLNPMPCMLVAVEPVPENYARTECHFRDNGLEPEDHWLVPHVVAADIAPVLFPVGASGSGAQNAIASNNDEAREQYVDALTVAGHDATEAALRNLLLHNTTGLIRPLGRDIDLQAEIKLVSALTLRELLAPFPRVDYLESDIQQSEINVFPPFIGLLREKVRRIHIGTHGKDVHHALHELFARDGWQIVFSFEPNAHHETVLGGFDTNDGVLTVVNPDL